MPATGPTSLGPWLVLLGATTMVAAREARNLTLHLVHGPLSTERLAYPSMRNQTLLTRPEDVWNLTEPDPHGAQQVRILVPAPDSLTSPIWLFGNLTNATLLTWGLCAAPPSGDCFLFMLRSLLDGHLHAPDCTRVTTYAPFLQHLPRYTLRLDFARPPLRLRWQSPFLWISALTHLLVTRLDLPQPNGCRGDARLLHAVHEHLFDVRGVDTERLRHFFQRLRAVGGVPPRNVTVAELYEANLVSWYALALHTPSRTCVPYRIFRRDFGLRPANATSILPRPGALARLEHDSVNPVTVHPTPHPSLLYLSVPALEKAWFNATEKDLDPLRYLDGALGQLKQVNERFYPLLDHPPYDPLLRYL